MHHSETRSTPFQATHAIRIILLDITLTFFYLDSFLSFPFRPDSLVTLLQDPFFYLLHAPASYLVFSSLEPRPVSLPDCLSGITPIATWLLDVIPERVAHATHKRR